MQTHPRRRTSSSSSPSTEPTSSPQPRPPFSPCPRSHPTISAAIDKTRRRSSSSHNDSSRSRRLCHTPVLLWLLLLLLWVGGGRGEDDAGDDGQGDDAVAAYFNDDYADAEDYIKYWTTYAIFPKRCIVYDDVDYIVYQVFENGYKQCSDTPVGTYITPAATYASAYMDQMYLQQTDQGNDDYVRPDASQYLQCTGVQVEGQQYYMQLGCDDSTSQKVAVNIYSDNTCETRSSVDGSDDANVDVSDLQIPFKQCQACVVWMDVDDDGNIDDQYYENRQIYTPLCSSVWAHKQTCDRKCQKTGVERIQREGWNKSDKVLLTVLSIFGCMMMAGILQQRTGMSMKETLLEEAAMNSVGLQQTHIVAIFVMVILVIIIFAFLCLKTITWTLLLLLNVILFAYLLKLLVDSGMNTCVMNPDGTVNRMIDSDDESSYVTDVSKKKFVPPAPVNPPQRLPVADDQRRDVNAAGIAAPGKDENRLV